MGQIGKAFRNEITPGNFTFRTREFEQMEYEFFCKPGTDLEWFEYFEKHCQDTLTAVAKKSNPLCFVKSWNEWGEGNYMEPDLKYGKGYIEALRKVIDNL